MPPLARRATIICTEALAAPALLLLLLLATSLVAIVANGDGDVTVFVVADWGGVGDSPYVTPYELTTAAAMERTAEELPAGSVVDSVLALGDNFYSDGVRSVDDARFRTTFEDVFNGQRLLETPWHLVAGNHDWRGNVSAQILYSKRSKRWKFPDYFHTKVVPLAGGQCAAFVLVDTVLLSASSAAGVQADFPPATADDHLRLRPLPPPPPHVGLDGVSVGKRYDWLEQQLALYQSCSYLFVAGHHPVWSIGHHGPTPDLVKRLDPLLVKHRVSAYLCGHEHNMQHIGLNGTDYFVAGAAAHVTTSTAHKGLFPPGSVRYYWNRARDLDGAFMVLTFGRDHANATFVEAGDAARVLYQAQLLPRMEAAGGLLERDQL